MAAIATKLLRRTHAAVQPTGLVHAAAGASSRRSMSTAAADTDAASKAAESRGQLQRKKEELYTLLNLVERGENYDYEGLRLTWWDRLDRHRNLKLLQRLSVQIHPKPNDREWRWHRGLHMMNSAAFCVSLGLASIGIGEISAQLGPDMKEEEGHDDDEEDDYDSLAWMKQLNGEQVNQVRSNVYGR